MMKHGQSLVEVIVAVGMVIVLITGLIIGTTTSVSRAASSSSRSLAVKYAQEGMELARQLRDNGWITFVQYNGTYCVAKDNVIPAADSPSDSCTANIDAVYTRSVKFTLSGDQTMMTVDVTVSWYEGTQTRNISLQSYLSQWK